MNLSLKKLLRKFKPLNNTDFEGRHFMTNVPWRSTDSYLHIVYDAAAEDVQETTIEPIKLPKSLRDFYREYNGADLFSDSLSLYGFFPLIYQFAREDWRKSFPYNIVDINHEHLSDLVASDIFVIGSYGFDRSRVFVEKATGTVYCGTGHDLAKIRKQWPSFEVWLTQEVSRMCDYFDEEGHPLIDLEDMLPATVN